MQCHVREIAPGYLRVSEGGGGLSIFGLPFLAAGLYVLGGTTGILPVSVGSPDSARAGLLFIGVLFTAVGGVMVFGRRFVVLDTVQRAAVTELRVLVPLRTRQQPIDDYRSVSIGHRPGDSDTAETFPVSLTSPNARDFVVCTPGTYGEARTHAAAIARHLGFDVDDVSSDHPAHFTAVEADAPLTARPQTGAGRDTPVSRPPDSRVEVTPEDGGVMVVIPAQPLGRARLVARFLPPAIAIAMTAPFAGFFIRPDTPPPIAWGFLGFMILAFCVLPTISAFNAVVRARRGRTMVTASPQGVSIRERRAWRTVRVANIDAADILDVDFSTRDSMIDSAKRSADRAAANASASPANTAAAEARVMWIINMLGPLAQGRGVVIKTRTGVRSFGAGLSADDTRYVHAVVRAALLGRNAT